MRLKTFGLTKPTEQIQIKRKAFILLLTGEMHNFSYLTTGFLNPQMID